MATPPTAKELAEQARRRLEAAFAKSAPMVEPEPEPAPEPERPAGSATIEVDPDDVDTGEGAYWRLSPREQSFVDAMVLGVTQADAARAAGIGPLRPDVAGCKMMRRPDVRQAVQERRAEAAQQAGIDAHRIMVRMADIAFGRTAVDSDVVMMRALETLLTYVTKSGAQTGDSQSVARAITERFQRARLRATPGAKPIMKLIPGGK